MVAKEEAFFVVAPQKDLLPAAGINCCVGLSIFYVISHFRWSQKPAETLGRIHSSPPTARHKVKSLVAWPGKPCPLAGLMVCLSQLGERGAVCSASPQISTSGLWCSEAHLEAMMHGDAKENSNNYLLHLVVSMD